MYYEYLFCTIINKIPHLKIYIDASIFKIHSVTVDHFIANTLKQGPWIYYLHSEFENESTIPSFVKYLKLNTVNKADICNYLIQMFWNFFHFAIDGRSTCTCKLIWRHFPRIISILTLFLNFQLHTNFQESFSLLLKIHTR